MQVQGPIGLFIPYTPPPSYVCLCLPRGLFLLSSLKKIVREQRQSCSARLLLEIPGWCYSASLCSRTDKCSLIDKDFNEVKILLENVLNSPHPVGLNHQDVSIVTVSSISTFEGVEQPIPGQRRIMSLLPQDNLVSQSAHTWPSSTHTKVFGKYGPLEPLFSRCCWRIPSYTFSAVADRLRATQRFDFFFNV